MTVKLGLLRETRNGDWEGLRVDGVLVLQEHRIRIEDFAAFANVELTITYIELDEDASGFDDV